MSARHRVFVSYHHANDENYKNIFNLRFGNAFGILVRGAVELGDIDPTTNAERIRQRIRDDYLRDTTVTVVLVGVDTWQRKHVDWEIYSSLRDTQANPRSGLLGILLPSFRARYGGIGSYGSNKFMVPPRLADNVDSGFATLREWSEDPGVVQSWIHAAYLARTTKTPNNSRDMFARNRSGDRWYP
jgi:hypothetical protein